MSWEVLDVESVWSSAYWRGLGINAFDIEGKRRARHALQELHGLASVAVFSPKLPYGAMRIGLHRPMEQGLFNRFTDLMVCEIDLAQDELVTNGQLDGTREYLDVEWKLSGLSQWKPKRKSR